MGDNFTLDELILKISWAWVLPQSNGDSIRAVVGTSLRCVPVPSAASVSRAEHWV
jgi:hypothetical protein